MSPEVIVICVPGKPVAQGRPRVRAFMGRGGTPLAQVYDPAVSRDWKQAARQQAALVMDGRPPLRGPVSVVVRCHFAPPASWPDWKREAAINGRIAHTTRPDGENVSKAAQDALKSIVWLDDSQVVELTVSKSYTERPEVRIVVAALPLAAANVNSKRALEAATE